MEERNLKITLKRAKELYRNNSKEMKELLLQVFSKEELEEINLPKTWREFCINYPIKYSEAFITTNSEVDTTECTISRDITEDRNVYRTKELAKASLAMAQLLQLRDVYRQGWKPDWNDGYDKYCILLQNDFGIVCYLHINEIFSFQARDIAEEFLKNFKDLFIKIKPLYE